MMRVVERKRVRKGHGSAFSYHMYIYAHTNTDKRASDKMPPSPMGAPNPDTEMVPALRRKT